MTSDQLHPAGRASCGKDWRTLRTAALALAALAGGVSSLGTAHAQVQRSMINPGFEANNTTGSTYFNNGDVPGWESTTGLIEIWASGFDGVASDEGVRHAEMNATSAGALYQNICLATGESFSWAYSHRARAGGERHKRRILRLRTQQVWFCRT